MRIPLTIYYDYGVTMLAEIPSSSCRIPAFLPSALHPCCSAGPFRRAPRIALFSLVVLVSIEMAAAELPLPLASVPQVADQKDQWPAWNQAALLGPFVRNDADGMPEASTHAEICHDSSALFIRISCTEPKMQQLVARREQRDSDVWTEDCVEVFLQSPRLATYAHFAVNPLGTRFDELGMDPAWNAEWQTAAERHADSWTVRIRLPWNVLGTPSADDAEWRLNVCRSRKCDPEISAWSPTGSGFHVPERFGIIRFGTGTPVPRSIAWQFPARGRGKVRISWIPQTIQENAKPVVRVNGATVTNTFKIASEGRLPLVLEAAPADSVKPFFRAVHVARITPLTASLDRAARRLAEAAETAPERLLPHVQSLRRELETLSSLTATLPPDLTGALLPMIESIAFRASLLGIAGTGAPHTIPFMVTSPLLKLLRHKPLPSNGQRAISLDAAGNEMAACQVVLGALEDTLLLADATVSTAGGPEGAVLAAECFRIRRVGYVHTCKPVYPVDYVGQWPDPLMKLERFDVRPWTFETLWVDVRVPPETKPGEYTGVMTVTARNADTTQIPIKVKVRGFTIPKTPSIATAFGLSPNWRVPQDRDAYIRNFLEHRITPYSVAPTPRLLASPSQNWRGASELRISIWTRGPGTLTLSLQPAGNDPPVLFKPMDVAPGNPTELRFRLTDETADVLSWQVNLIGPRQADLAAALIFRNGTVRTIRERQPASLRMGEDGWLAAWPAWKGSAWENPDQPARWDWTEFDKAIETYLPLGLTTHRAPLKTPLGGWAEALQDHARQKGWLDLFYTYLFDEPRPGDYPKVNRLHGAVKLGAPNVANMMTARHFPPELKFVDIWCPEAYSFDPEAAADEQAKGKTVWWYVAFSTRHPYPNVWIDYPAIDCRIWPWMTWKHDLDGMLYWSATAWSRNDPWRTGETFHDSNGDGSLLYPGIDGKPVDSIRWECLRDGMEDYEVFSLLEAAIRELRAESRGPALIAEAEALCRISPDVLVSYKHYNLDPQPLLNTRIRMSTTLEAMIAEINKQPAIKGRPRRRAGVDPATVPQAQEPSTDTGTPPQWTPPPAKPEKGLVMHYPFDTDTPYAHDVSGFAHHGVVHGAKRTPGKLGNALWLLKQGRVVMPPGIQILGPEAAQGTVALWVMPRFDPQSLSDELYKGYAVLIYLMESDGNGLPDGYDEIGIYQHGKTLLARCGGTPSRFAAIPSPLKRDTWTHLAMTWRTDCRILYVNGKAAARQTGPYPPASLDMFTGRVGSHPPHDAWSFNGLIDEVKIYRRELSAEEILRLAQ